MGGVGEERELVLLSMLLRTGTPSISTRSIYVHIHTCAGAVVCHIQQSCVSSAEKAEQAVKEAAEAINKQLPKEAQGGSMQPLVEEKEEGEGQALDTFSVEIDALDQVRSGKP